MWSNAKLWSETKVSNQIISTFANINEKYVMNDVVAYGGVMTAIDRKQLWN